MATLCAVYKGRIVTAAATVVTMTPLTATTSTPQLLMMLMLLLLMQQQRQQQQQQQQHQPKTCTGAAHHAEALACPPPKFLSSGSVTWSPDSLARRVVRPARNDAAGSAGNGGYPALALCYDSDSSADPCVPFIGYYTGSAYNVQLAPPADCLAQAARQFMCDQAKLGVGCIVPRLVTLITAESTTPLIEGAIRKTL